MKIKVEYGIASFFKYRHKQKNGEVVDKIKIIDENEEFLGKTRFNLDELNEIFSTEGAKLFLNGGDFYYHPRFYSTEGDKIVNQIKNIKKKDFKDNKVIKTALGNIALGVSEEDKEETYAGNTIKIKGTYFSAMVIGTDIVVENINHEGVKFILEDKVRREIKFDDPYKRP